MALQHAHATEHGYTFNSAYSRISAIHHSHTQTVVFVETWADAAARTALARPLETRQFDIPWADGVSLTSAYTALKALPEFTGAMDV
jgi:hypothetical protein